MSEDYGAFWGEIPCAMEPPPVYRRTRGFDVSESTVTFPRSYFRSLAPEQPATDDEVFKVAEPRLPLLLPFIHVDRPITFAPIARPPFAADLVFAQGAKDAVRVFRARHLYFVEARIPDPENAETADVEIQLAPITRFWPNYGWITRTWNLGLAKSDVLMIGPNGVELTRAADRLWAAHTAKEGGRVATPLREIVQELLHELPGSLEIVHWPDAFLADKPPPEVRCFGARPLEVLRVLMDVYHLYPDVGPDLAVRVCGIGEGLAGELEDDAHGGTLVRTYDPATGEGVWKGHIVAGGDRWAQRPAHRPREVIVLGDRTVFDAEVDALTPVLYYEEPEQKDRPPRTVVLEATPHNLELLAQGRVTGGDILDEIEEVENPVTDEDRAKINLILGARDTGISSRADVGAVPVPGGPAGATPEGPRPGRRDGMFWQRIVLEKDDAVWTRDLPHLVEPVRQLIGRQLFRYYMLPRGLRRLLPMLERAGRDYKGDRLPIKVEAFSFRPASARVPKEPPKDTVEFFSNTGLPTGLPGDEFTEHDALVNDLNRVQTEIANFEARRERLRAPTIQEFAAAIQTLTERRDLGEKRDATAEGRLRDKFYESYAQTGRTWLRAAAGSGLLRVLGADSVKDVLNWYASDGLSSDDVEARIAQIDVELKRLREVEEKILAELNPRGTLERQLGAVEAEIKSIAATGARVNSALRERAEELRRQIAQVETDDQTKKPPADDESPYKIVNYHQNLSRAEVEFRVVDKALGIIEVLGGLPGWLGDHMVADPTSTFFLPMPVRISFGTYNGLDVDLRSDPEFHRLNFYVVQACSMLASRPELLPFAGRIGNRLPPPTGEDQVRFTFSRDSVKDGFDGGGRALVGRHPWPIVVDDRGDPFRLLVRLPADDEFEESEGQTGETIAQLKAKIEHLLDPTGFTRDEVRNRSAQAMTLLPIVQGAAIRDNRAELLARALPWARAALSAPDLLDTGSLVVEGPRAVPCTGRVSAVEVTVDGEEGVVTTVSFQHDAEPLPGMDGPVRPDGPVRLVFGIDTEKTQNS